MSRPTMKTLEWWILFFLISRLNIACSPLIFNLQDPVWVKRDWMKHYWANCFHTVFSLTHCILCLFCTCTENCNITCSIKCVSTTWRSTSIYLNNSIVNICPAAYQSINILDINECNYMEPCHAPPVCIWIFQRQRSVM